MGIITKPVLCIENCELFKEALPKRRDQRSPKPLLQRNQQKRVEERKKKKRLREHLIS